MKRTPLKRKTGLKKVSDKKAEEMEEKKNEYGYNSTIKRVSMKQKKVEAKHYQIKKQLLEEGNFCEVKRLGYTQLGACNDIMDLHEILPRGRGGRADDPDNVVIICRKHHIWVGDNPLEAKRLGLLKSWEA